MPHASNASSSPHNQMVLPPNDWQKMVGMAISVAIMVVLTLTRGKAGCPCWKAEMTWLEVTGGRWRQKLI
jgi:hypothetical protein